MVQEWWKSPVFWSTLATAIIGLLSTLGFWSWIGVTEDLALRVAGAAITVASLIVTGKNNPTNPTGWGVNEPFDDSEV